MTKPTPRQIAVIETRISEFMANGMTREKALGATEQWLSRAQQYLEYWERVHARIANGETREAAIAAEDCAGTA